MPQIVYIDITTTAAETPNNLQEMGAIVSFGGSTLTTGTFQELTGVADYTAIATAASGDAYRQVNNFYQQGNGVVYLLELGADGTATSDLNTYIQANPQTFYAFDLPSKCLDEAGFADMLKNYVNQNSKTYFFADGTEAQELALGTNKCMWVATPSPTADATEYASSHVVYEWINANSTSAK